MDKQISGSAVSVNEEGYLTDLAQWTREVGIEIAKEEGVEMTDKHWEVIEYLQNSFRNNQPLSIRSVGKHGPVSIKELYELFPGGPLKKSSRIAGIPKPASCI
ncbi:MAG: TusE/DsrC/DsvC family sulfur relay protein [Pirellulaceae bacterium]